MIKIMIKLIGKQKKQKKDKIMRLWSLHPKYLDRMGLLAVWREK